MADVILIRAKCKPKKALFIHELILKKSLSRFYHLRILCESQDTVFYHQLQNWESQLLVYTGDASPSEGAKLRDVTATPNADGRTDGREG